MLRRHREYGTSGGCQPTCIHKGQNSRVALLQRFRKLLADEQERWMIPTPAVDREFQLFAGGNHDDLVMACKCILAGQGIQKDAAHLLLPTLMCGG